MSILRESILFCVGGGSYTALELAFRGRSHISMFCLGGACFLAIGRFNRRFPRLGSVGKMAAGSAIITAGELLTGLALNRNHRIWDYRAMPLNFQGQICPAFSLVWMPVSALAGWLYEQCDRRL